MLPQADSNAYDGPVTIYLSSIPGPSAEQRTIESTAKKVDLEGYSSVKIAK